jgi:hypothetical protein
VKAAKDWYYSEAYQSVAKHRKLGAIYQGLIVEGVMAAYSKYGDRGGRSSIAGLCSSREVLTRVAKDQLIPETCNGPNEPLLITSIKNSRAGQTYERAAFSGIARFERRVRKDLFYGDGHNAKCA